MASRPNSCRLNLSRICRGISSNNILSSSRRRIAATDYRGRGLPEPTFMRRPLFAQLRSQGGLGGGDGGTNEDEGEGERVSASARPTRSSSPRIWKSRRAWCATRSWAGWAGR